MAHPPFGGPAGMPPPLFGPELQLPPGWPPGFMPGAMPPPGFPLYPGAMLMPGLPQQLPAGLMPPQAQLQQHMPRAGAAPGPGSPLPRHDGASPGIQPAAFNLLPPPDGMVPAGGLPPGFQISFAQQRQQQLGSPQPLQQQYGPPGGTLAQSSAVSRGPSRGASASGPLQGGAGQQQPYQQGSMPLPQPIVSGHVSGARTPQGTHHVAPHSASGRLQVGGGAVNMRALKHAGMNASGCQTSTSAWHTSHCYGGLRCPRCTTAPKWGSGSVAWLARQQAVPLLRLAARRLSQADDPAQLLELVQKFAAEPAKRLVVHVDPTGEQRRQRGFHAHPARRGHDPHTGPQVWDCHTTGKHPCGLGFWSWHNTTFEQKPLLEHRLS